MQSQRRPREVSLERHPRLREEARVPARLDVTSQAAIDSLKLARLLTSVAAAKRAAPAPAFMHRALGPPAERGRKCRIRSPRSGIWLMPKLY
jgi:hypothetical protein